MLWFEKRMEWWRWLIQSCHVVARICQGPNLRSRHPRTTCATMCLVWNDLMTIEEGSRELSCWMSGTGMAAARYKRGLRVFYCT
jgi:hypothetical protein